MIYLKVRVVFLLAFLSFPAFSHYDDAYFHRADNAFTYKKNWMASISDETWLSEMALPGTHDSGTYKMSGRPIVRTQVLTIKQQLEYGIRVLDIRVRHTGNKLAVHHGPVYLHLMFGEVINQIDEFLQENPTETVLVRIEEEHKQDSNNTRDIRYTLKEYVSNSTHYLDTSNESITLGSARGKYILLSTNFYLGGINYGYFRAQDDYYLGTNWDLHNKWLKIKAHFYKAVKGYFGTFFINYLSGSGGTFPYFVASGHSSSETSAPRLLTGLTTPGWKNSYPDFPRVSCFIGICSIAFEGTNILARDYIKRLNKPETGMAAIIGMINADTSERTIGIVMADFPGESLIQAIIDNNTLLKKRNVMLRQRIIN